MTKNHSGFITFTTHFLRRALSRTEALEALTICEARMSRTETGGERTAAESSLPARVLH